MAGGRFAVSVQVVPLYVLSRDSGCRLEEIGSKQLVFLILLRCYPTKRLCTALVPARWSKAAEL